MDVDDAEWARAFEDALAWLDRDRTRLELEQAADALRSAWDRAPER